MRRIRRWLPITGLAALLATLAVTGTGTAASAYGAADQPIAQVEISGNCDNPTFWLCQPPTPGGHTVGLGGIWLWIEIDGGQGATSGTADVAGAVCGHSNGSGALAVNGSTTWTWTQSPAGMPGVAFLGTYGLDPNGYYTLQLPVIGETLSIPVDQGHYSWQPTNGVSLQTQVAP